MELNPDTHKWRHNTLWVRKNGVIDSRAWVEHTRSGYEVKLWSAYSRTENAWSEVNTYDTLEEAERAAEIYVIMGLDTASWTYEAPDRTREALGW